MLGAECRVLSALGAIITLASPIRAQRVDCQLDRDAAGQFVGPCSGLPAQESTIALHAVGEGANWTGTLTLNGYASPVDLVGTQLAAKWSYVLRSNLNWFNVAEWEAEAPPYRLVFDRSDLAPPTRTDLTILRDARRRLEAAPSWDRADDRDCENDAPGSLSLYCALARATREAMGKYYHRQPAMQSVRRAIDERWRDRVVSHRLIDFNNHPATTMDDVLAMLDRAVELTEQGIAQSRPDL